jgi:subtilisin family serine protease
VAVLFLLSLIICCPALINTQITSGEKLGARLRGLLNGVNPHDEVLVWVYLNDKGSAEHLKNSVPADVISERSIRRRLKVRPPDQVVDYTDLPVEQLYVEQLASHVIQVRQRSKWFNSVSVRATKAQISVLEQLPFVRKVDLVTRFRRNDSESVVIPVSDKSRTRLEKTDTLDYGPSFIQDSLINVPAVHNTGNYAQGVIVGVFDNGFRLLNHEVFDSLDIIATYDFVDHKVSVIPNNPDPSFGSHGVFTLSAIAGYKPGELIGPAFGASYVLARTENDSSETPLEEDNWVAAIEWGDSIGVEVTSTSLGYFTYDPPYPSWTWEDMNGNTTVITRAADMAVARGIVVANSAGNAGSNPDHNTLVAPADGDSVMAIGAVLSTGERASFSSVGPTTSSPPRTKPDVMAQGVSVYAASGVDTTGYVAVSGTSLSCPLAAGVAALIIHARPGAGPVEIADAMRLTASNGQSPNNEYGWGIVDAVAAIEQIEPTGTDDEPEVPTAFKLEQNFPNPFNPATTIGYALPRSAYVRLGIYNVLGEQVIILSDGLRERGHHRVVFDGKGLPSGVYFYRLEAHSLGMNSIRVQTDESMTSLQDGFVETRKLVLLR